MKVRFTGIDVLATVSEIKEKFLGYRLINTYDIDNKTYLFRLSKTSADDKVVLLVESGIRIHPTEFEWPKNLLPSGFSMKMRKHLRNKRLESIHQLGVDRIVDIQFGTGIHAFHVILELYDRGNMLLTDHEFVILHLLRPRTDKDQDVKFATRERYPIEMARTAWQLPEEPVICRMAGWDGPLLPLHLQLAQALRHCKPGEMLRRVVTPVFEYGPQVLEHCAKEMELSGEMPSPSVLQLKLGRDVHLPPPPTPKEGENEEERTRHDHEDLVRSLMRESEWFPQVVRLFQHAREWTQRVENESLFKGIITYKVEAAHATPALKCEDKHDEAPGQQPLEEVVSFLEYHPFHFHQLEGKLCREYPTFSKAVDEFYSQLESQKQDMKSVQQEKAVIKKFENVKRDHEKRIEELKGVQEMDKLKGQLIEMNLSLVDQAILIINHALANQVDWTEIDNLLSDARDDNSEVAKAITKLKLETNHIAMILHDPYDPDAEPLHLDIDLSMTAFANAKRYFDMKRTAETKEQKTVSASEKALKSAEMKTKQMLKEVYIAAKINKIRKPMWFEKFLWFISSENYIVVGGRDQQQNEILVKRYLKPGDVYVHADLRGASSVIVKNHRTHTPDEAHKTKDIPPKTLNEAGQMAVVYSSAWTARVVTAAYWVRHDQVSKTAPSGEYLTTGSFMIRGKKNYLQPCHLQFGFGLLFKLSEDSMQRHVGERRVRYEENSLLSGEGGEENEHFVDMNSDEEDTGSEHEDNHREKRTDKGSANDTDEMKAESHSEEEEEAVEDFPDAQVAVDLTKVPSRQKSSELPAFGGFLSTSSSTGTSKKEETSHSAWTESNSSASKPRISAKQRRQMKKGVTTSSTVNGNAPAEEEKSDHETGENDDPQVEEVKDVEEKSEKDTTKGKVTQPQVPLKRGQRNKLKKIKEKYKDQDEEDRILRMALLQRPEMTKAKTKKRLKQEKQEMLQAKAKAMSTSTQGKGTKGGKKDKEQVLSSIPEDGDVVERRSGTVDDVEKQEHQETVVVDEVEDEDEDVTGDATSGTPTGHLADTLTGIPQPEDELYYALPVCAPYHALAQYKFKVKLTPGNTKRGKACKMSLNSFMADKTCTSREKDLIRALKDQDITRNFPQKVKVSAPNIHKAKVGSRDT